MSFSNRNIQEAKEKIQKLLDKYNKYKDDKNFAGNEKQACQTLIVPLIKDVLDWNTEEYSEFKTEESKAGKRIDYVVCNENISQFIVEAKAPNKDVFDNTEYYKQALAYGYSKNHDFAILTNFRQLVILACKIKIRLDREAEIARIDLTNLTDDNLKLLLCFEKNYWISSGKNNILYTKLGTHKSRIPVDEQLLDDMKIWRSTLLTNIQKNGKNKFDFEDEQEFMKVEEEVQKFIDRLIFICFCEDKELEEAQLKGIMYDKEQRFGIKPGFLLGKIQELFEKYRKTYDSDLFDKSYCDRLVIEDDKLMSLIQDLREPKDRVAYDFKSIEADILGKVYEQFIGHVQTGKKRFKEKEDLGKRKKEGIYYTPKYIVDYIVNNTVKEYLKGKSFEEINKVKILDPACGSGSFLLRAFDILVQESENRLKRELNYDEKKNLMLNCIHGVDLDERAVAIAKLNLALKLAERNKPLPLLNENIKCGNSLIDDKEIAGFKAFVWEEEFKDIMSSGGFDVVVGNPPYGAELLSKDKLFLKKEYPKDKTGNTAAFFILKGLKLVKDDGYLTYIVPKQLTYISSWSTIREELLKFNLTNVIDASEAFTDVELEQIIFIVKKIKKTSKQTIVGFSNNGKIEESISNKDYFTEKRFPLWITNNNSSIFNKVLKNAVPLASLGEVNWGAPVAKFLSRERTEDSIRCLRGREVQRYTFNSEYFIKNKDIINSYYVEGEKLFFQRIVSRCGPKLIANYRDARMVGTYCDENIYADKTVTMIWNLKIDIKYLLGILNSRLISWFAHRYLWNRSQLTMEFMYEYARNFPIHSTSTDNVKKIVFFVNKMLSLNKRLNEFGDKKTEERTKIEAEIKKTDDEIDEFVYKIYGITEEEKKIVEESLR